MAKKLVPVFSHYILPDVKLARRHLGNAGTYLQKHFQLSLRGWVHIFMNINEFVKNNCLLKITEMIFTIYIPSLDIHNI